MSRAPVINARPLSVHVLPCDTLTKADKAKIAASVSGIKTGDDAKRLRGKGSYGYIELDPFGRAGVITYRGMEVALLFKRQALQMTIGELDATPAVFMKSLDEAWIRIDLLENNPNTLVSTMSEQLCNQAHSHRMTEGLVARQREEIEMKDVKVEQLESKVTGLGSSLKLAQERVQRYVKALGRRLPDPKPGDKPKKATVKAKVKAVKKATKKTKKR